MSKHLIIVGAGRTGKHVIKSAILDKHEVYVIEKDEGTAREIAANFDCTVILDDASSAEALKEAGGPKADALVTTTNDDAVNMLVMMMGKEMGIRRLISSVNDEDHIHLFERLGVDTVESPFRLNGQYLYHAIRNPKVGDFMDLGAGIEIVEFTVSSGAIVNGKVLKELDRSGLLPPHCRFVVIRRMNDFILPEGETRILAGDLVAVVIKGEIPEQLHTLFNDSTPPIA